ncbi:MAG: WD40 repeat protein [Arenicella sp.]|jgi:WD40 repeat protein
MRNFQFLIFGLFFNSISYAQETKLETILQKGHAKYVTSADFHPSGKYAVTGGYDNAIILWNIASGKEIRMFNKHTSPVWSVVFSPDGNQILSTSADQTTKLYDVNTAELVHSWDTPKDDIREAHFSYDGKFVIQITNRNSIFLYDRVSGKPKGEYEKNYGVGLQNGVIDPGGTRILNTSSYKGANVFDIESGDTLLTIPFDKVFGMEFSPDGSKIALSSTKQFAKLFDAESGKDIAHLEDVALDAKCDGCNTKQAWSPDSKYLITMSNKVGATLWDANSGRKLRTFNQEKLRPTMLKFSPNKTHVIVLINQTVYAYQIKTGKQTMKVSAKKLDYFEINFSPEGHHIIIPGESNTAELWDVRTGKKKSTFSGYLNHERDDGLRYSYDHWTDTGVLKYISMRRAFAIAPDDKHIVLGSLDSIAVLVNLQSGRVVREFKGHKQAVIAFAFSPDGKTLATAGGDRHIKLWEVETGKEIETLYGHRDVIFDLAFNSDGTQLVSASWDGTMGYWDLPSGQYQLKDLDDASPYKVGFSPSDLYLVSGDARSKLTFWEADAVEEFRTLIGNTDIVGDFDFSPSSKSIVTASWDGKVKVWDVLTGMQLARLSAHEGAVYAVDWDPQNRFIASAGADNTIRLWDSEKNKVVKELTGHTNAITDLHFTSDGSKLISQSVEGQIKVWDMNSFTEDYSRIQISRNEWLSTTANGHFDGTKNALNLVNYVSGMEVVPVGSLFDKYFSPGLIKRINDGEKFDDTGENINELIESTPLIAFHLTQTSKRSIEVESDSIYRWKKETLPLGIHINSQKQELEEIRIYNNGKLIIAESLEEKLVFRGGERDMRHYEIPLSDGQNHISAKVINTNRTESSPTDIIVEFDGEATNTDLYILSIGINDYQNSAYNLDYAVNDSKSFTKALKAGGDTLFHAIHEYSIINDKAIKSNITATILAIKKEIGPEDVFVFYYAGHGVMSYEKDEDDSDFYIVTNDVVNLYGDTEVLHEKAISAKELMAYSVDISAEKQLFVLDACHSGGALESFATRGDGREKALAQLARSTGTFFLTASQDAQYANEVGSLKHGLFTYALLEIMEGTAGDQLDKKVTISEVKSYVEERVPELSEKYHGSAQYPTSYSFGQDFPLVILK